MKKTGHDGDVINSFLNLSHRLSEFGMHIKSWGPLGVVLDSDPHSGYVLNNVTNIDVIEGFVIGLEFARDAEQQSQ